MEELITVKYMWTSDSGGSGEYVAIFDSQYALEMFQNSVVNGKHTVLVLEKTALGSTIKGD